ncbi:serine protein kinase RIO [Dactylosporangium sucinum]|uniref:non-specific serine/threonine protein kinase n=1 Tax=Dactylosporangium sucinum TaxID=1424081 RepID=A0A917T8F4_9ACTN|nr:RIO1 family regulatory kinase/ATPase [Dactylosporangium sucinum]GGM13135.1 RIO kinase 1 [Dactylosporangium sucinum]
MRDHTRSQRRRFDDDDATFVKRNTPQYLPAPDAEEDTGWSSWDAPGVQHGPEPIPDWVITELAARDTDLGVLKTGKEADVHLVERAVPDTDRRVLLAAKRYRAAEHRLFHRDAGYLEGRRVRASRVNRAMEGRTSFGREMIAGQWAQAEFAALAGLWELGVAVPYPVQLLGTELMLEFIGEPDGTGAPRLAQVRADRDALEHLWAQLVDALRVLARSGLAHGDLSPYNLLVDGERLVLIDLPQIVDVVINPNGREFLARDVRNVARWFVGKGLEIDPDPLIAELVHDAGLRIP